MSQLFILLLAAWTCSQAQNISAGLSGTVIDATSAAIANAEVSVRGAQTGFVRLTRTNESGFFSYPDLFPGTYELTVQVKGFKKHTQTSIALLSGEQRSLGRIRLDLGETAEVVTVSAEAGGVQLGSSERSGSITHEMLENMALRGRDLMDAVGLLPGIVDTADSRDAPAPDSIGNLFIAGGRSNAKNMTIDGVTNLDTGSNGSVHSMPSMDSVGEVKVLMSNYAAEYGRNSGGAITVITRGGGRQFHGSAGWFHRHENYSANNYFNNQRGVSRPPYRYNIMSYTVSGPVYLPGKFNRDRSRIFFFFSQEFQRQRIEFGSRTVTVPTTLQRQGDFSQTLDVNGRIVVIQDPLNDKIPFPGNIVPAGRIDPVGRRVLELFPLPNFTDPNPSRLYQWNYVSALSDSYPRRTEIVRLDFSPHSRVQSYLRMSNTWDEQHAPYGSWVTGSVNFPLTPIVFKRPGRGATLHTTTTLAPTLFSETIFGVSQNKLYYFPENEDRVSKPGTGIQIAQWNPEVNPSQYIPNMSFGGVPNAANPSLSNGLPYYNSNTIFSLVQNFSKIAGTHSLKFGLYFERTRKDQMANALTRGQIDFGRNGVNPYDTNWAYSNALIGSFLSYTEANARPQGQYRFTNLEWYVQDAWRMRPRLLLDYGVRFYANAPQYDARLQLATFLPERYDPAQAVVLIRPDTVNGRRAGVDPVSGKVYREGFIGTFVPGIGDPVNGMLRGGTHGVPRGLYSSAPVQIGPRIGFAWDPFGHGRTAIRGGGGVFFDRIQGNPTMNALSNPPTIFTPSTVYGTIEGLAETGGTGILAPSAVTALAGRHSLPATYNFSFGLQQQFGKIYFLDFSYVGSLTRHALWQRNLNPVPLGAKLLADHPENRDPNRPNSALPDNFLRPVPGYTNIMLYEFASTSSYNSLQASFRQRWSKGLQYNISYTFSKALGTGGSDTYSVSPFFNPRSRNYGVLPYDRTHVASFWYNYNLPRPGKSWRKNLLGRLADNWQISGTGRVQSGGPFTPGFSLIRFYETSGTPSEGARIDIVSPAAAPKDRFAAPAPGSVGNSGVNVLRHPGFTNVDVSLFRQVKLERFTWQFRLETYNTTNSTQFSAVSTGARFDEANLQVDPLFLEPAAARSPRRVQLAIRLNW
jgi:hypothetical protein